MVGVRSSVDDVGVDCAEGGSGDFLEVAVIVDSVGSGDRRGCDECKELLESEQWLAL
jgi:hypothetical protein